MKEKKNFATMTEKQRRDDEVGEAVQQRGIQNKRIMECGENRYYSASLLLQKVLPTERHTQTYIFSGIEARFETWPI